MVNEIKNGITNALFNAFADADIYTDNVEQGIHQPCFFVMLLDNEEEPLLLNRAYRTANFDIHYINDDATNAEREQIASKLYALMRFIDTASGKVHGVKLRHETVDNILHFFVTFKITVKYYTDDVEKQENLNVNIGVKDAQKKHV